MSLDPDAVTRKSFETSFRGYDPMEVQAFLLVVADELRAHRDHEFDIELRLSEAERRAREAKEEAARRLPPAPAPAPPAPSLDDLDHDEIARLIGEETARVLGTARASADEIRTKAEAEAVAILAQAGERARARLAVAEDEATTARDTAERLLAEVEADVERQRSDAAAEAERRLEVASETAEQLVADATAEAESLVLSARTEAETLVEAVASEADELRTVARSEASSLLDGAKAEAEAVTAAARAEADAMLAEAILSADEARSAQLEEARALVLEAKVHRRRTLDDLSARRHQALEQLEQLRAGRDHLADALAEARQVLDDLAEQVDGALDGARAAAVEAKARVDEAGPSSADQIEAEITSGHDGVAATDRREASHGEPEVVTTLFARIRADREAYIEAQPLDLRLENPEASVAGSDDGRAPEVTVADPSRSESRVAETLFPADLTGVEEPESARAGTPSFNLDELGDDDARAQRDRALSGPERGLGRALKRVLSEEQNHVLDAVRTARSVPELTEVLGDAEAHALRYAAAARGELRDAAYAGITFLGLGNTDEVGEAAERPDTDDLAAALSVEIVSPLRDRLATCWADVGDDELELLELLRATYRQWRARVLPEITSRFVAEAFNRGLTSVGGADNERWLVPIA